MGVTSIEWTERSINPLRCRNLKVKSRDTGVGHYCEKISAGCAKCYASEYQRRVHMPAFGKVKTDQQRAELGLEWFLDESKLEEVRRRKKPSTWFWCDMTDLFGDWVKDEWIESCFKTMRETPWHTHQILTKRPARMAEAMRERFVRDAEFILNIHAGVTVENQDSVSRIHFLYKTPAAKRFLSCEPLLGPIDLSKWLFSGPHDLPMVDQVIIGGESGHKARPCNIAHIRDLLGQLERAGVNRFVKQLGRYCVAPQDDHAVQSWLLNGSPTPMSFPVGPGTNGTWEKLEDGTVHIPLKDKKGKDMNEWPTEFQIREEA